ncbi:MAG: hypothetical protein ACREBF_03065 [Candidatus Micrarchaeales archaeon]
MSKYNSFRIEELKDNRLIEVCKHTARHLNLIKEKIGKNKIEMSECKSKDLDTPNKGIDKGTYDYFVAPTLYKINEKRIEELDFENIALKKALARTEKQFKQEVEEAFKLTVDGGINFPSYQKFKNAAIVFSGFVGLISLGLSQESAYLFSDTMNLQVGLTLVAETFSITGALVCAVISKTSRDDFKQGLTELLHYIKSSGAG